ncbi:hypothetical protein [uncultured Roseivirga sp.]|uniref:hypothetical protein n=1 Tax=uncultured Roseivirga sp. TaxID=543088 RepID=UPI0030DD3CE4|tara:strand:- start:1595 stop:2074 length:480 start_codon:yes stop_codon:yes gene_type:complete
MTKTKITYRNWEIEVNKQLTELEYSKIDKPSAESCGCGNCLNYIQLREKIFPNEVIELFEKLGIDRNKEIEISHMAKLENGLHYYSGWFHFIGGFNGMDCSNPLPSGGFTLELTQVANDFGIGFTKSKTMSVFKTDQDLIQVEFDCKTPWAIESELESE